MSLRRLYLEFAWQISLGIRLTQASRNQMQSGRAPFRASKLVSSGILFKDARNIHELM
jgi:hypothetical protein